MQYMHIRVYVLYISREYIRYSFRTGTCQDVSVEGSVSGSPATESD
jgi:hypothetical protein